MAGRLDLTDHRPVPVPTADGERLTLVTSARTPTLLTFAEDVELRPTGPAWHRVLRRFPAGLVHAARLGAPVTLCGTSLDLLEAFGSKSHPFETIDPGTRCFACDVAAERPTA